MKKSMKQILATTLIVATLFSAAAPAYAATFGSKVDADGKWTDTTNLTWTFNSGEGITIGRGPTFTAAHPEITDPEYFIKEAVLYPGEADGTLNNSGQPKSNYTEGTLPLLQEFVHSFDWIHSDELTRLQKVHDRIANGRNGNKDQLSGEPISGVSFQILQGKIGNCGHYASDFQRLASYVGLECVQYSSGPMHTATLTKINGQWITVDPFRKEGLFNNTVTIPVDYETEYNWYKNEVENSESYQNYIQEVNWQRQAEAGEISWGEYFQKVYPDKTLSEIEEMIGMDLESYEALWKN